MKEASALPKKNKRLRSSPLRSLTPCRIGELGKESAPAPLAKDEIVKLSVGEDREQRTVDLMQRILVEIENPNARRESHGVCHCPPPPKDSLFAVSPQLSHSPQEFWSSQRIRKRHDTGRVPRQVQKLLLLKRLKSSGNQEIY